MDGLLDIVGALQGEAHTDESLRSAERLHAEEMRFADALLRRELDADQRRSDEQRVLETKLLARKMQVELDIGRRDATRDSVLLRGSAVANVLVSLSVMIGCAFMFVYQAQLPAPVPESPANFTFTIDGLAANRSSSSSSTSSSSSSSSTDNTTRQMQIALALLQDHAAAQLAHYSDHLALASSLSGGAAFHALHAALVWAAISLLVSAVWVGLVLQRRLKLFKVHLPLHVYDCGHVHAAFGGFYACRCLALETAMRRLFLAGTGSIILAGCVIAWEVSIVSFGSLRAALLFVTPVALGLAAVAVGTALLPDETAHADHVREREAAQRAAERRRRGHAHHRPGGRSSSPSRGGGAGAGAGGGSDDGDGAEGAKAAQRRDTRRRRGRGGGGPLMEAIDGGATVMMHHSPMASPLASPLRRVRRGSGGGAGGGDRDGGAARAAVLAPTTQRSDDDVIETPDFWIEEARQAERQNQNLATAPPTRSARLSPRTDNRRDQATGRQQPEAPVPMSPISDASDDGADGSSAAATMSSVSFRSEMSVISS